MTGARVAEAPLPDGFAIVLDESADELASGVWFGGSPARVLTLTPAGAAAGAGLLHGAPISGPAAGRLARRFTDAGLAHPRPPASAGPFDLTVVIPVLDRPLALDRCLAALGPEHPVVVVDDGSRDPAAIAAVARRHGARLVRRPVNGGPGAARNTGLALVDSEFVAFVDSDCVPPAGWLTPLVAHLADPLVAAIAPRIRALDAPRTALARYTAARGSLDLGAKAGRVAPTARVSYVPTAALVARRSALTAVALAGSGAVFDERLRVGEDVDLVWRLDAAGWRVRYDPTVQVAHDEPDSWAGLLRRRFRYGTSAAPLTQAHPGDAAPLVVHPWPVLVVVVLLARRPLPAVAAFAAASFGLVRTLRRAGVPTQGSAARMAAMVTQTGLGLSRYTTQVAGPVLLTAVVAGPRRLRFPAAALLLGAPVSEWARHRRELDPARYLPAHLADEVAYGAGVWAGALTHHTSAPLRPILGRRRARGLHTRRSEQGV